MGEKPDFIIYDEPPKATEANPKPEWVKVGAGWFHKDANGGNIQMDNGKRYLMRARSQRAEDADANPQA